jgi:hypothetical protein
MATWTDVARVMKALPAVDATPDGRSWRLQKKLIAWERPLRAADKAALGAAAPSGPILGVHVPLDVKDMLLASRPAVYFTTPHFDGWPAILVRLPRIRVAELRELLHQSWLERAPKKLVAAHNARRAKAKPAKRAARARPVKRTANPRNRRRDRDGLPD